MVCPKCKSNLDNFRIHTTNSCQFVVCDCNNTIIINNGSKNQENES